jgi:hypothetical protein
MNNDKKKKVVVCKDCESTDCKKDPSLCTRLDEIEQVSIEIIEEMFNAGTIMSNGIIGERIKCRPAPEPYPTIGQVVPIKTEDGLIVGTGNIAAFLGNLYQEEIKEAMSRSSEEDPYNQTSISRFDNLLFRRERNSK